MATGLGARVDQARIEAQDHLPRGSVQPTHLLERPGHDVRSDREKAGEEDLRVREGRATIDRAERGDERGPSFELILAKQEMDREGAACGEARAVRF